MALTDSNQILSLSTTLGDADNFLQSAADPSDTIGTLYLLGVARNQVFGQISSGDDQGAALVSAIRAIEKSIPGTIANILVTTAQRLETYFTTNQSQKFRLFFKTGVVWTDHFRTLWRKANKEELIVRLGHSTRASGAFPTLTSDHTIGVDSLLEVRTTSLIGAAPITVVLTLTRTAGATENVTVTVPATTPSGTVIPLPSGRRYVTIASAAITGGTDGDALEIWVS